MGNHRDTTKHPTGACLRLNTLHCEAGEATVREVVDVGNAFTLVRNAYDHGEMRFRVALANLQTLTGTF